MPFKIVRNDITKMNTEAIVNTANDHPTVGTGCDHAVYQAAGYEELLTYRQQKIGFVKEGDAFITPGFGLPARYIIHAVSPLYIDGQHGEEDLLRSCYRNSLALAAEHGIRSVAFPLISTGGFGYPKEEGMRIAVDEIHAFLLSSDMQIYLVVFDEKATRMGRNLYPDLEIYIDRNYVEEKHEEEYGDGYYAPSMARDEGRRHFIDKTRKKQNQALPKTKEGIPLPAKPGYDKQNERPSLRDSLLRRAKATSTVQSDISFEEDMAAPAEAAYPLDNDEAIEEMERRLNYRMAHMADTFPEYLLYLIQEKGMKNADVYKRAIVDKKVFSKIKNNPDYHPQKRTALCLCIGTRLNLDQSKDLLARAGYALSPCDKTDIIFSYFIEHGIYDMIELDIQLEEHGLPCIIS